jgi:MraZ protein
MPGLIGKHTGTLDQKSRLILPARLRKSKSVTLDSFVLTLGFNKCLFLFPVNEWEKIEQRLENYAFTHRDANFFLRMLMSHASEVSLDRQHRILITPELLTKASIEREVLILGAGRRIELWAPPAFEDYVKGFDKSYEEVAQQLMV